MKKHTQVPHQNPPTALLFWLIVLGVAVAALALLYTPL
jgi:hypothetical protein